MTSSKHRNFLLLLSLPLLAALLSSPAASPSPSSVSYPVLLADAENESDPSQFYTQIDPMDSIVIYSGPLFNPVPAPVTLPALSRDARGFTRPLRALYYSQDDRTVIDGTDVPTLSVQFTGLRNPGAGLGIQTLPLPAVPLKDFSPTRAYAVDPSALRFSTAAITKTAEGQALYKCPSWQFVQRACPGGWFYLRALALGESYRVPLSNSDPAFLEGNRIAAYNPSGVEFGNLTLNLSGGLSDAASDDGVFLSCRAHPSYLNATAYSNGTFAFRSSIGTGINLPHVLNWTDKAVAALQDLPTSNDQIQAVRVENAPGAGPRPWETLAVTLTRAGALNAYVFNGSEWTVFNSLGSVVATDSGYRPFDIAYETNTSRAMLLYAVSSANTAQDLGYRIWNGSAWSAEAYIDDASHANDVAGRWVRMAANPWTNSSEIAGAYVDRVNNFVTAFIWNGTDWNNQTTISPNVSINTKESLGVAYGSVSGTAMVVAGNGTIGAGNASDVAYQVWNGANPASWTAPATFRPAFGNLAVFNWLTLKADPSSDRMMLTSVDSLTDLATGRWDGSAWTADGTWDAAVDSTLVRPADFDWAPYGSTGVLIWGTAGNSLSYKNFTAPSSWQAARTLAYASTKLFIKARGNPLNQTLGDDVLVLGLVENSSGSVGLVRWNGNYSMTTQGENSVTQLLGTTNNESFDFAFSKLKEPLQYTAQMDFNGTSNLEVWNRLNWSWDGQFSTAPVNVTLQLYDYAGSRWAPAGDGYLNFNATVAGTDSTQSTAVTATPFNFRDPGTGAWKLRVTAISEGPANLLCKIDWMEFNATSFALLSVNASNPLPFDQITASSYWTSNTANPLGMYALEWNATGACANQTWLPFPAGNNTWGNYTLQVPGVAEGKNVTMRFFANDSADAFNASGNLSLIVQNVTPVVNSTAVNLSAPEEIGHQKRFCITAVAGDTGTGVQSVKTVVNYPNGTVLNLSLSDTGCLAGGAGDNLYGVEVETGDTPGNLTLNATYANDSVINTGAQLGSSPIAPLLNVTVNNPPEYGVSAVYLGANLSQPVPGDALKFFSFWVDDTGLATYWLEWNATNPPGFSNTSPLTFSAANDSWANLSVPFPAGGENKTVWWRLWASGSSNRTPFGQFDAGGIAPVAENTTANATNVSINMSVCVNASVASNATVNSVWALVNFPNGTAQNWTMSDTGCGAGGAGDGRYGVAINVSQQPLGNFTVNTTYADDAAGNLGWQDPFPLLQVRVKNPPNPLGGSGQYAGFFGTSQFRVSNQTGSPYNDLYLPRQKAGSVLIAKQGTSPDWGQLKAASLADLQTMDAQLGVLFGEDLLENNYAGTGGSICGLTNVRYLTTSEGNWQVGVLYTDQNANGAFDGGDNIIFCANINPNAADWNSSRSDYEISFPRALGSLVDFWQQA